MRYSAFAMCILFFAASLGCGENKKTVASVPSKNRYESTPDNPGSQDLFPRGNPGDLPPPYEPAAPNYPRPGIPGQPSAVEDQPLAASVKWVVAPANPDVRIVKFSKQLFRGHTSAIRSAVFSQDGKFAVSGSDDATARLWDIETGKELARAAHPKREAILRVAFGSDCKEVFFLDA